MMRVILSIVAGVVIAVALAAWMGVFELPSWPVEDLGKRPPPPTVELGGPLYTEASFPPINPAKTGPEPIILRGSAAPRDKQDVPSSVSGQILFVGVPVPDGAVEAAGVGAFMVEPYNYNWVQVGDQRIYKFYRRLTPGHVVDGDQVVAMIENSKAITAIKQKQTKIEGAKFDELSAKAAADVTKAEFERDASLYNKGALSKAEYDRSQALMVKAGFDYKSKGEGVSAARDELTDAKNYNNQHLIRNKIPFGRCVIQAIYKDRGFAVREQETILVLNSLEHMLAEALVDGALLDRIKPEMIATLEPTQEMRPFKMRVSHRSEVTAIAVTNDADAPRIVSAGLDRTVIVHEAIKEGLALRLMHDHPVRALACSPAGADHNLCLVGAGSKLHVWNLDRKQRKPEGFPHDEFEAHSGAGNQAPHVTCLAFSPDGVYFATGAEDGSIAIWKTADRKLVYRFDADHGVDQGHSDPITTLAFTPQCQLVSAARDNTVRVWKLKEKGPELQGEPIAGRTGTVGSLGVSSDGRWHLFDKGRDLQFVSLQDPGLTITTLRNPGVSTPFETLAQFSPDGSLILTAGLADGRMQLWKSPTETARGFEVRQFTTEERQATTCAAFAPLNVYTWSSKDRRAFAVSGNATGDVYLWPLPTKAEVDDHRIEHVKVSAALQSLDPNTHQARITVHVPNPISPQYPNGRLIPGKAVTVVIGEE
jgi:WD40 repeat protein